MSRYVIPARQPQTTCVVGYDPPLGTFFAQLYSTRGARRRARLMRWVGTDLQELPTLDALVTALADVVTIPPEIQRQLVHDQHAPGCRPHLGTQLLQRLRPHREEEHA